MTLEPKYIADEEDGPAVAVLFDLPSGDQVWSGEVSRALFEEQDIDEQAELVNDYGSFITHAAKGDRIRILARCADHVAAMDLATAYAEWLARLQTGHTADRQPSPRDTEKQHPTPVGGDWQDIATAPRDGTVVDLWCPRNGRLTDSRWITNRLGYTAWHTRCVREWNMGDTATHWRPLPPPPEVKGDKEVSPSRTETAATRDPIAPAAPDAEPQ